LGSVLLGWRTVAAVEIEPYCREVIMRRQRDHVLPLFPIWDDIRTFDGKPWRGRVDIVTAGFPCQRFSVAGKRQGASDERNMWPDTIRVIREVRPRFALLENVPGLLHSGYFGQILGSLATSGYGARWDCIPASALGAPHQRDRLWIAAYREGEQVGSSRQPRSKDVGHASQSGLPRKHGRRSGAESTDGRAELADAPSERRREAGTNQRLRCAQRTAVGGQAMAYADEKRQRQGRRQVCAGELQPDAGSQELANAEQAGCDSKGNAGTREAQSGWPFTRTRRSGWWDAEPALGRVAHGVANRVDRLRALGEGQVPGVVRAAWLLLGDEMNARERKEDR
jgi:DNA (cytosine-5)-methyltransferase 1